MRLAALLLLCAGVLLAARSLVRMGRSDDGDSFNNWMDR